MVPGQENKVCKLRKSLYDLKQDPKEWYEKFDSMMIQYGFIVNTFDSCAYSKLIGSDCVIKCLYVDALLMFGTNLHVVNETKNLLSSHFEMNDMGEVDVILAIKIGKMNGGFSLCQSLYIGEMLQKFNNFDVTLVRTPYDHSIHLKKIRDLVFLQLSMLKL